METLHIDIYRLLSRVLSLTELHHLELVSTKLNKIINNRQIWKALCDAHEINMSNDNIHPREEIKIFYEHIPGQSRENLHRHIAQLIGPTNFLNLPVLNLGEKRSDYIDYVMATDLTHPITKGVDIVRRPFISLRYLDISKNVQKAITVFHRYSDQERPWVNGTCYNSDCFEDRLMTADLRERMNELVLGHTIDFTFTMWNKDEKRAYRLI